MRSKRTTASGRRLRAGLVLLLGLALCGCGGAQTPTISGKVSYKGNPLPSGTVIFYGGGSDTATAVIQPDGSYKAVNVPLGAVRIAVITPKPLSDKALKNLQKMKKGQAIASEAKIVPVPEKYHEPNSSGLTFNVANGLQTYNIDLK